MAQDNRPKIPSMPPAEYLGQSPFQITMAPARAVYLIADKSEAGLRRAIQEASSRWGGMAEPIVPVLNDGTIDGWWKQVAELAGVAAAVNVDVANEVAVLAAQSLGLPLVLLSQIDNFGQPTFWTCHPIFVPRDFDPATSSMIIACQDGGLWQAVAAGDLMDEHLQSLLNLPGNDFVPVRPSTADQVGRAQFRAQTLLDRTVDHFGEFTAANLGGRVPAILWVTDPNSSDSFLDCIHYWNVRALRSFRFESTPMMIVPFGEIQHWIRFSEQYQSVLVRPEGSNPDVFIRSISVDEDGLREVGQILGLQPTDEPIKIGRKFGEGVGFRSEPFTYMSDVDVRYAFVFGREYGESINVEGHVFRNRKTVLRFSSPVPFEQSVGTLMRFGGEVFQALPKRPCVANAVLANARWRGDQLEIQTVFGGPEYRFELQIPSDSEAVDLLLRTTVKSYKLSDKGKLAAGLLARTELTALLSRGVYEATVELTTPRSKELLRELKRARSNGSTDEDLLELAASWGGRAERRFRHGGQLTLGQGPERNGIETLCSIGWAERGLEVDCNQCGMRSFVPLSAVSSAAVCPGCCFSQSFSRPNDAVSPPICYRLDSLVDRASDQGVVPHLLVMAAIEARGQNHHLLPGIDVVFNDEEIAEVDIFGVIEGKVVAGEVKSSPADFTLDQITRDVTVSRKLGADAYILASVKEVPADTVELATTLCDKHGIALEVFGPQLLRP